MYHFTKQIRLQCILKGISTTFSLWGVKGSSVKFMVLTTNSLCEKKPTSAKVEDFMASFYGWGLNASRLQSLRGGSLLFITEFPEIPGIHFIDLGRMKG